MNKKLIISLSVVYMSLCNIVFANYTISGAVQSEDGDPIKKGLITLVKESNGEEVDKTKVSRKGKFKLKKISSGKYIIKFPLWLISNPYKFKKRRLGKNIYTEIISTFYFSSCYRSKNKRKTIKK